MHNTYRACDLIVDGVVIRRDFDALSAGRSCLAQLLRVSLPDTLFWVCLFSCFSDSVAGSWEGTRCIWNVYVSEERPAMDACLVEDGATCCRTMTQRGR